MKIAHYAKTIVAVVSAGLLVVQTAVTMSDSARGWVTVSIAVVAAISVYMIPNAPAPAANLVSPTSASDGGLA